MAKKIILLFLGFFLIAFGTVLMLHANLGMNPFGTFHQGIASKTGLTFGVVSQLTGLGFILLAMLFKIYPGVATLLNMYFCGFFIDQIETSQRINIPSTLFVRWLYLILGIFVLSLGIYTYLHTHLGAGPRDGFMLGLVKITKSNVKTIRTAMEISVLIIGTLLGGPIGVGTIVSAVLSGLVLHFIFDLFHYNPSEHSHLSFVEFFNHLSHNFN
ncbi:MAG: hypothetical protein JXR88_17030 [Clostridia bacterium]|nr:hypothetical protein [Clostridia bacterium]